MKPERCEHKDSQIDIALREGKYELRIDGKLMRWGLLPGGLYYLHDFAYDWHPELIKVAQRYVEHRARAAGARAK
ncbi:MAG: twin-arginine translocation pathway signal protein [Acidobacteriota bacterium]